MLTKEMLPRIEHRIQKLVPEARIVVAHGQLPANEMEERLEAFINYDYDILLSTTIIESGVDIPNVNTILIFSADKYGLADLEAGKIDILIGTHKIIGKGVKWHDLGLLIIDEEQKFGVAAKERLKSLRTNIDVLTLTATPIPRTLQFSLLGARDLSVMTTPPQNRYPVQTELITIDDEDLAVAGHLLFDRLFDEVFVIDRDQLRLHRIAVLRRSGHHTQVPGTQQRELQGPRDRRCRKRQYIYVRPERFQFFLHRHAEFLLLVND